MSGFLVARSWDLDPSPPRFAAKRLLRLWPALVPVVLIVAIVVGPIATTLPTGTYFADGGWHYIVANLMFDPHIRLPGVFESNPVVDVSSPFWTLPVEVKAYALVAVAGAAGLILRPLVPVLLVVALWWLLGIGYDFHAHALGHWLEAPVQTHLLMVFLGGVFLYTVRDRVRLDWRIGALAAIAVWATPHVPAPVRPLVAPIALPYLCVLVAYRTPAALRGLTKPGDLSYGIYLWSFPLQQSLVALNGGTASALGLLLVSGPLTYLVALASWRLVERPAMGLKPRAQGHRAHATAPQLDMTSSAPVPSYAGAGTPTVTGGA